MNTDHAGQVTAVRGAVLDLRFAQPPLPAAGEAVQVVRDDGTTVLAEVASQLSTTDVRAVALESTEGLARGLAAHALGQPLQVPVGPAVLGRLLDVTGRPGDGGAALADEVPRRPIHRAPPPLAVHSGTSTLFATGLKVIDLLTPLVQGGKAAMFGGAGVG
ncbi:MAG TPA: F0F1 ATP synthase subunit beta, partial [Rubrivivax sp.]|nr:F0F1 ATP synthase subunit beta [Rubrivivax sp.]